MNEKSVVVTGAAKGIGQATVIRLAAGGFIVFAGVRRAEDGEALQREHPAIRPILLDVTDPQQIAAAVTSVSDQVGASGLYGLVNNAGIAFTVPLEFVPIEDFRNLIEVNLVAQLAVTQAFLPALRQARGRIALPFFGVYDASKFALEGMSDSLRQELAPWGIEVVVIEPGAIATPMWESGDQAFERMRQKMNPHLNPLYSQQIERGRQWGERTARSSPPPDKVAQAIERALTAARPRTRYTVGTDAFFGAHVTAKLPDRLRDRILRRLLR